VLPGDLPTLAAADVGQLIRGHVQRHGEGGSSATLCPASRDGGSNALLLSPPTALPFHFGPDSARRHAAAATVAGVPLTVDGGSGFSRDIDTPADVQWLLQQRVACATIAWLRASGIAQRLKEPPQ
jgi:2-phospho-L-lactate guanylyltransferase